MRIDHSFPSKRREWQTAELYMRDTRRMRLSTSRTARHLGSSSSHSAVQPTRRRLIASHKLSACRETHPDLDGKQTSAAALYLADRGETHPSRTGISFRY